MLESSRLLHQIHCQCRTRSPPIIVHLPHLCLIEAVRLQIVPEISEPLPQIRIGQKSFVEARSDNDSLLYTVRSTTTTLTVNFGLVSNRRMAVSVYGFDMTESPDKSQLIDLLNLSAWFRQQSLLHDVICADLLCGLALIDSRLFLQASEVLYSAANLSDKVNIDGESCQVGSGETRTTICSRESLLLLSAATLFPTSKTDRLLQLLGEISCQPMTLADLHRSAKVGPLVEIVGPLLAHSLPYVRQAAARALEFFLETIGCDCIPVMETIVTSLLMSHDTDLIEPILQAVIGNLFMMTPDAVQDLSQDVLEPALHQALIFSISDCSISTSLRLILAAFHRLKADMMIGSEMVNDLILCSQDRYASIHWIVDQVWAMVLAYAPLTQDPSEIIEICTEILSTTSTPSCCVRRSVQLLTQISVVNLEKATGDVPKLVPCDLIVLINGLNTFLMSELRHGDRIDLDLFQMHWQALILTVSWHNAIQTCEADVISIDEIAVPIVESGAQILRHTSPRSPLVPVLRHVVPTLEPGNGLMMLLSRILVWLPDCSQDDIFDLIHVLITKLRHILACDQVRDLIWAWSQRSTTRSHLADRCRRLIQQITIQTNALPFVFRDLAQITDPARRRDLLQFVLETIEIADSDSLMSLELTSITSCLQPMLLDDELRPLCLQILKQFVSRPQTVLDSSVLGAVLDAAEGDLDPATQFAIVELLGMILQQRPWPWKILERVWIYLLNLANSTNWNNIRRMARWASLILTRLCFSNANLDQVWRWGAGDIWHDVIHEACHRQSCAESRLWGLKLIWALAFRSPVVLRSAPGSIIDLITAAHFDPNAEVKIVALLLTDIINGRADDEGDYDDILGAGSPPGSLMELTMMVPDLGPGPARSAPISPERDLDIGSDLSEGIPSSDLADDELDIEEHDRLCQDKSMRFRCSPSEAVSEEVETAVSRSNTQLIDKHKDLDRDIPGQSDLVDLSLIELQWIDD